MTQLNPPVTATGTLSKVYRKVAMPLTDKGKKIMSNMKDEYGDKKGESVFYASANKGRIKGVHGSPARVHLKKEKKAKGIARSFLKSDSRGEDQQDMANHPPGNAASSSPTRRKDIPPPRGSTGAPNFVGKDQTSRQGFTEDGPAGKPTAEAGGTGRGGGGTQKGEHFPRVERAKAQAGKARTAGSAIDEAINEGASDFNAQVKHRSKMIRDGRKRDNARHS